MKNDVFICPKCGCEKATRVPIELFGGVKDIWYGILIASLLGVAISPICLFICFSCMIIIFVLNIIRKYAYRNEWIMQCSRCGTEYTVPNPDREKNIEKEIARKKLKAEEKAEYYNKIAEFKELVLKQNGMLADDERLIDEIKNIGYHKNIFTTKYGNIKVTNKSLIYYNEKGSLRIPKSEILQVKKRNYFLFIPTGIQIKTPTRTLKFVVEPRNRDKYIQKLIQ